MIIRKFVLAPSEKSAEYGIYINNHCYNTYDEAEKALSLLKSVYPSDCKNWDIYFASLEIKAGPVKSFSICPPTGFFPHK